MNKAQSFPNGGPPLHVEAGIDVKELQPLWLFTLVRS